MITGLRDLSTIKKCSHAQIGPQGSKVNVVGGGGNHYTYY